MTLLKASVATVLAAAWIVAAAAIAYWWDVHAGAGAGTPVDKR